MHAEGDPLVPRGVGSVKLCLCDASEKSEYLLRTEPKHGGYSKDVVATYSHRLCSKLHGTANRKRSWDRLHHLCAFTGRNSLSFVAHLRETNVPAKLLISHPADCYVLFVFMKLLCLCPAGGLIDIAILIAVRDRIAAADRSALFSPQSGDGSAPAGGED